ncbi:hypothetical protein [uncultured Tateyamaria sp.]|uniref:hypothetical protein n=1 Tax=uncultured Tateyamaria sp. TaxID=455651 RepID=UPI00260CCDD8|nr:hypothetical protein [uncultured Tateyamaria sp.]
MNNPRLPAPKRIPHWTTSVNVSQMLQSMQRARTMFGLIRTPILILIAFLAGLMFERSQGAEACTDQGGVMRDGVCWNE